MSDPILDEIRAENPYREHYDADLWEARIHALYLARRAEILADELRRVACAPPHVREDMLSAAVSAWYDGHHKDLAPSVHALDALFAGMNEALDCERRGVTL